MRGMRVVRKDFRLPELESMEDARRCVADIFSLRGKATQALYLPFRF